MKHSQINPTKVGGILLLMVLILLSGCNQKEEIIEEEPKHCLWVCISNDMSNFTNVQGCGEPIKEIPALSTCSQFYGEFKLLDEVKPNSSQP